MKKVTSVLLILGSVLYADYGLVYEMKDTENPENVMTSTFKYKDAEHGRVDTQMQGRATMTSMLVRGKKAYMITYDEEGTPSVMDMDEMMKMGAMFGGNPEEQQTDQEENHEDIKWKRTGKSKTVAGLKGEIWDVTVNEDGKPKQYEIVMSKDPDYVKAVQAYEAVMKRMVEAGAEKQDEMFTMIESGYAPIEVEDGQLLLRSFSKKPIEADAFELPKGAQVQKSPFGSMFSTQATDKTEPEETRLNEASSSSSSSEPSDKESINKGVDDAVEMFKSLF